MKINTSGQLELAATRGEKVHGVLVDDPSASGQAGELVYMGEVPVECGGTFEEGDALTTDANGKAIKAELAGDWVFGTAKEAGASGARASALFGTSGSVRGDGQKIIVEDYNAYDTTDQVAAVAATGAVASGVAEAVNVLHGKAARLAYAAMGTQTITAPVIVADGLNIGMDQTDDDGVELWSHQHPADGLPFIIGSDAAFYFLCKFSIADVSGTDDFHIGFRRAGAMNATFDNYLDLASLGCEAADGTVDIVTIKNNGASGVTDTGDTILDGVAYQFKILVSAAGVVTYQHDIAAAGTLAAPTTTAAFTFDDGDCVVPFVHMLQANAAQTGVLAIHKWEVGYQ